VRGELRNEIRKAKRAMWTNWVEEGKEVWDIVRVCENPFGARERCGTLRDGRGRTYETNEKLRGFVAHNLITEPAEARQDPGRQERRWPAQDTIYRVEQALKKTRKNSAPGPDGVSWKLLKMIRETTLGKAILDDVA